ncbi:DUF6054 family protein [Romboutsia sp.]|uniref:DUF6054 family protein n=1 Tax=Romboutsia sp. TaxID=1965302 RepID=UPI003F3C79C8
MAKYERHFKGDFNNFLKILEDGILAKSVSASCEGGSDYENSGVLCAVRVYERFSAMGGNRVSLNITLLGKDEELFISAITSGGSQAMFFKINTLGEEAFLDGVIDIVDRYILA